MARSLGAAVLLMLLATASLIADGSDLATPARALVLGLGIALCVAIGAELFPSTVLTMVRGVAREGVDLGDATLVALTSLLGNLAGAIAIAGAADAAGVIVRGDASVQQRALGALAVDLVALSGLDLLLVAVLGSAVLCTGLWLAGRAGGPRTRLLLLWAAAAVATGLRPGSVGGRGCGAGDGCAERRRGLGRRQPSRRGHGPGGAPRSGAGRGLHHRPVEAGHRGRRRRGRRRSSRSSPLRPRRRPRRRRPRRRSPAKKAPAKKAPAKKAPAKKAPAKKAPAQEGPAKRATAKKATR